MDLEGPADLRDRLLLAILAAAPQQVLLRWEPAVAILFDAPAMRRIVVVTLPEGASPEAVRQVLSVHVKTVVQGSPETTFVAIGGGAEAAVEIRKAAPFVQAARMGFYHLDDAGSLAHVTGQRDPALERAAEGVPQVELDPGPLAAALARGQALVQQERAVVARLSGRQAVTASLAAACVALFGLGYLWSGGYPMVALGRMGENHGAAVRAGEVYRLLASAFLHADLKHLAFNMMALWSLGPMLEAILGPRRYLLLYAGSALGGSLASALVGAPHWSVGASGAIWGLMAALFALTVRPRGVLPAGMVKGLRSRMAFPLILNVLISLQPNVDMRAHLGGGLAGFVLMMALTAGLVPIEERETPAQAERRPGPLGTVAAALAVLAMAGSIAAALAAGQPWTLVLRRVPIGDTGLTVETPNGLRGERERTKGEGGEEEAAPLYAFGQLRDLPAAFEVVVAELPRVIAPDELPEFLDGMQKELDDRSPKGWTRRAAAKKVTLGGHPAVAIEHDAPNGVGVKGWAWPEGKRVVVVRGYSLGKRPAAWEGIEERVAASVKAR